MGGWRKIKECHFGQCYHTQIYLNFWCSIRELGSKDLSDYKNSKAYSYYKSGRFQPLQYRNLSGSKCCFIGEECTKPQSIKDPFHKPWMYFKRQQKSEPAIVSVWYGRNMYPCCSGIVSCWRCSSNWFDQSRL